MKLAGWLSRRGAASLTFMLATATAYPAIAQSDAAAAAELFERGRGAMKQQDYTTACAAFADSVRFDTKVGTLLNLADCEEHLGRLVIARTHWQQAANLAHALNDSRENVARQRFTAVDPRVAKLAVRVAEASPPNVTVRRDDVELGSGSLGLALPVDPGPHTITTRAPGYEDNITTVPLKEGEVKDVVVGPGPKIPPPPPPPPPAPEPPPPATGTTQTVLGIVALGLGVGGGAVGTIFGLKAKSTNDASFANNACDSSDGCTRAGLAQRSDALRDGNVSTIAFIAGGALVVTGVVLLLTTPSRRGKSSSPTAGLLVIPRAAGLEASF
jgi:hypothetical protein